MSQFKEDCEWCELPLYLCSCNDEDETYFINEIGKKGILNESMD